MERFKNFYFIVLYKLISLRERGYFKTYPLHPPNPQKTA
ncbi:hypothetical protein H500_04660 [Helicobacter pylori CG-IMSS-2012]|nr:hypothetical protein H500_04660 [Helicobacter pylori CG-IMSS-2012]